MALGSNNPFPSVLVTETASASITAPAAGKQRVFIDTADNKLKRKNSGGTVTIIESGASLAVDDLSDVVAPTPSDNDVLTWDSGTSKWINQAPTGGGSGVVVQVKNTQTGTLATGTTAIPLDNTIPQNTEGDQYMTLAITPTSATNKLKIDVVFNGSVSGGASWLIVALFQDSTASALAAFVNYQTIATGANNSSFTHYMTAGTTSSTTFKVRAGRDVGTTLTFNGQSGGQLMGGVMASSITITEIVP